ncbi:MAG TPA: Rab family GTPase [Candidatus Lokiarchaeia archaeon]|nr:Rab family GTPase [Candidatus Lokiarchaeia archaeon]
MITDFDYVWKIIADGAGGVGKTSLLHRYIHDEFKEDMKMTIGIQFHHQQLERQGKKIGLMMWDLGGQERFRFTQTDYIRGAMAAFLLFDLTSIRTLDNICTEWIPLVRENASPTIPIVLVGTKMDVVNEPLLKYMQSKAEEVVQQYGLSGFTFTSAKMNINVGETILYLVDLLIWHSFETEQAVGYAQS